MLFTIYYYDILDYTSVNYRSICIHMKRDMFKTWKANHKTKIMTSIPRVKKRKGFEGWQDAGNF